MHVCSVHNFLLLEFIDKKLIHLLRKINLKKKKQKKKKDKNREGDGVRRGTYSPCTIKIDIVPCNSFIGFSK